MHVGSVCYINNENDLLLIDFFQRIQRLTGGVTGGFRSSLHQLRGTKVKREQMKLDRQTIHVKFFI